MAAARVEANRDYALFIGKRVAFINERLNLVETLVGNQHYILTDAHLAASHINYRRFFTVNSLICLRMEDEAVFTAYHEQLYRWYNEGLIQGLRVDHIDGLAYPKRYIDRLRSLFGKDCYIIAEKILARDEMLPADWSLQGTTGYEFLAATSQVLTDPGGSRQLLEFYRQQIIELPDYEQLVFEQKYDFLRRYMGGELDNLLYLLGPEAPMAQDTGRMKTALAIFMSSFPVYRVYPDESPLNAAAQQVMAKAFANARQRGAGHYE